MAMSPKLLRPRASGFNPKSIAGLFAWYDASDSASITLNGSNISQINDKSGNGRNLTQSTATLQPARLASGINGRAVIAPDGTDDRLLLSADIAAFKPRYVVGVFMPRSTNSGAYVKVGSDSNGFAIGQGNGTLDTATAIEAVGIHEVFAWRDSNITMTQDKAVVYSYQYETSIFRVSPYGTADLANANMNDPTNIQLGGYGTQPGGINVLRYTDGYIGEFLIYTTVPTDSGIRAIERYLGQKWGVTII